MPAVMLSSWPEGGVPRGNAGTDDLRRWPDGPSSPLRVKPASSQCNVRPCETRYSTTVLQNGECGQILETLKGQPPSFCKLQIYGLGCWSSTKSVP